MSLQMMVRASRYCIFTAALLQSEASSARPLGEFPAVEIGNPRIEVELLSDLWTSPYQNKENPQRLYQAEIKIPLYRSEAWKSSLNFEGEGQSLGRPDLAIGQHQILLGQDLRSQSVGFAVDKTNEDKSSIGFFISYESASDEPFQAQRDISKDFTLIYVSKLHGAWQWLTGVDQSKNRGFRNGELIPFVGFIYQTEKNFRMTAGFPFLRLDWVGNNDWGANFTAGKVGLHGELIFYAWPDISLHARSGISNRSYSHKNRVEDERRLFYEDKYLDIGFRKQLSEKTNFGIQVGHAFDRKVFEGEQVFDPIGPVVEINADLYGGIQMEYLF